MKKRSINRNIVYSVSFSLLAKGLSFFQSIVVSWKFGAGRNTDILYFAVTFMLSCATICNTINQHVIVPNYIRIRDNKGEPQAMRFANMVFTLYTALGALAVAFMLGFPVRIYSGLSQFGADALLENQALLRLTAPMLLLVVVNMLITDLFTAYKHFTMPMIVEMVKSGFIIFATVVPIMGNSIQSLALAMLLAHVLQFIVLVVALRVVLRWKPTLGRVKLEKKVGVNVAYVIVGQVVVFFANILVMNLISGFADGVYTAMEYAQKINTVIATVVITQLTTIVGIQIIENYNNGETKKLNDIFGGYMRASFYIITPVCFGLSLCARPLMSLLFERGEFTGEAAAITANFFSFFILVVPFMLLAEFFNRLIIAQQIQKLSVMWKIVLNVILMLCLFLFVGRVGYVGAPLGMLVAYVLYTVFLFAVVKRYFPYIENRRQIVVFLCKCVVLNVVLWAGVRWVFGGLLLADTIGGKLFALVVCAVVYIGLYLLISLIPGMFLTEIRQVISALMAKKKKPDAPGLRSSQGRNDMDNNPQNSRAPLSATKKKLLVSALALLLVFLLGAASILAVRSRGGYFFPPQSQSFTGTMSDGSVFYAHNAATSAQPGVSAVSSGVDEENTQGTPVVAAPINLDEYGFLTVRDGHFYYQNGQRAKFWGVNIVFEGCMPEKTWADSMALELKMLGVNAVRLISMDSNYNPSVFVNAKANTTALDTAMLDKMDYFIACLKSQGISVVLCMYAEREFTEADGVVEAGGLPQHSKYASLFDERMILLQQDFAKQLLCRQNPYTGLTYAQDPAVALYQITNENTLFRMWYQNEVLPPYYETQLDEMFYAWIMQKYGSEEAAAQAWGGYPGTLRPMYKERGNCSEAQVLDLVRFYQLLEERYSQRMLDFYRNELGIKAPVAVNTAYGGHANLVSTAAQDFNSAHQYYDFIEFPSGEWNAWDFAQTNESMIRTDAVPYTNINTQLGFMSFSAVEGMPLIVDEYNSCFPNDYQYEIIPVISAYAAFQDWDGLFLFAYSYGATGHSMGRHTGPRLNAINDFFLVENNAVKVSQMRAAALMFLRGDVQAANKFFYVNNTDAQCTADAAKEVYTTEYNNYGAIGALPSNFIYTHGLRRVLHAGAQTNAQELLGADIQAWNTTIHTSDTGELVWDGSTYGEETVTIGAGRTQGAVGFLAGQTLQFEAVCMVMQNNCSALVTSLDGQDIGQSNALLVSVAGRIQNRGMVRVPGTNGLSNWGDDAIDVEKITGQITIQMPQAGQCTVTGLSANQEPLGTHTLQTDANGVLTLNLTGEYLCYEIVMK